MNWRDVPVYITNWNNLDTGFRTMIDWFLAADMKVTVLDNQSTYPLLLDYYREMAGKFEKIDVGYNSGVWGFWQAGFNTEERTREHYITTDSDCPPDESCPKDLIEKLLEVIEAFPEIRKVSPGLRIDDIPDSYSLKQAAIGSQTCLPWIPVENDLGLKLFHTHTDTTMTLWRAGYSAPGRLSTADENGGEPAEIQMRLGEPYFLKHVPWYADSNHPSAESLFYRSLPKMSGPVFGM